MPLQSVGAAVHAVLSVRQESYSDADLHGQALSARYLSPPLHNSLRLPAIPSVLFGNQHDMEKAGA